MEFKNSGWSPDKTSKLQKGSGVDRKARGSREEWKWIGSPLTPSVFLRLLKLIYKISFHVFKELGQVSEGI